MIDGASAADVAAALARLGVSERHGAIHARATPGDAVADWPGRHRAVAGAARRGGGRHRAARAVLAGARGRRLDGRPTAAVCRPPRLHATRPDPPGGHRGGNRGRGRADDGEGRDAAAAVAAAARAHCRRAAPRRRRAGRSSSPHGSNSGCARCARAPDAPAPSGGVRPGADGARRGRVAAGPAAPRDGHGRRARRSTRSTGRIAAWRSRSCRRRSRAAASGMPGDRAPDVRPVRPTAGRRAPRPVRWIAMRCWRASTSRAPIAIRTALAAGEGRSVFSGPLRLLGTAGLAHALALGRMSVLARPLDNPYLHGLLERMRHGHGQPGDLPAGRGPQACCARSRRTSAWRS